MLLLKVVGILLKYELNELAITSGSLIMMPFSLMEVLGDLRFFTKNGIDVGPHFLTISKRTLKKILIILLSGSSGYFSE